MSHVLMSFLNVTSDVELHLFNMVCIEVLLIAVNVTNLHECTLYTTIVWYCYVGTILRADG